MARIHTINGTTFLEQSVRDWTVNGLQVSETSVASTDRYWVGASNSSWNNPNNWSTTSGGPVGAGVPTSANDVYFDGSYITANCLCDVAIDVASLTVEATYDGKLDFGDSAYSHIVAGDFIVDGTDEIDCGDSTITCSGDFDISGQTTWTYATSTVVLNGTSKTLTSVVQNDFYALTIDGTISTSGYIDMTGAGALTINAGKQLTCVATVRNKSGTTSVAGTVNISSGQLFEVVGLAVPTGGQITGDGTLSVSNTTISDASGTIDPELLYFGINITLAPGTYGSATSVVTCTNVSSTRTLTFGGSGDTFVFPGDVVFDVLAADSYTIDAYTNNAYIEFQGDVTLNETSGTLNWSKATFGGNVQFNGTTVYTDNTVATQNIGDVELDGTSLTLNSDMNCDVFTGTSGALDINGANTLTTTGNMDWTSGMTLSDPSGGTFDIGNDFTADGQTINAASTWYLNVSGTSAVASGTGYVENSDASGGTQIDASAGPWTHDGSNVNWKFSSGTIVVAAITESVQFSEDAVNIMTGVVSTEETVSLAESAGNVMTTSVQISESVSLSDTSVNIVSIVASIVESVQLSDVGDNILVGTAVVAENVVVDDSPDNTGILLASVSESAQATDTLASVMTTQQSVSESVVSADSSNRTAIVPTGVSESVVAIDSLANIAQIIASVSENSVFADINTNTLIGIVNVSESMELTDVVTFPSIDIVSLSNSIFTLPSRDIIVSAIVREDTFTLQSRPTIWRLIL